MDLKSSAGYSRGVVDAPLWSASVTAREHTQTHTRQPERRQAVRGGALDAKHVEEVKGSALRLKGASVRSGCEMR
jgi:hypothetical protein